VEDLAVAVVIPLLKFQKLIDLWQQFLEMIFQYLLIDHQL
jgi:hypothetical protein